MKKLLILLAVALTAALLTPPLAIAAEMVQFEPVRAPSSGPENAPVTIIEIADFM